ncbi:aspartate 1-decarboxylase [candidate division WOR-3 bacterium]|nr:aspartate 1-decarboxylase [candidate division WOR-3 bacterium]
MQRIMCKSKVYGLWVTGKSIEYGGSIEMPPEVLEASDILPGEIVLVVNINTGARFNTYVIKGKPGECRLLGGAARLGDIGDKLLVISYGLMDTKDAQFHKPKFVFVDEKNRIKK